MTTVLIVDDSTLDQQIAASCIPQLGYDVAFAANGREALDVLRENPPDIVLTDLDMPEVDGLELVTEIKHSYPAIPVILMTAKGSEEIAVAALKRGAASYVPKRKLKSDLASSLDLVQALAQSQKQRRRVFDIMTETQSKFVLSYNEQERPALVRYLQDALRMMNFCDEADMVRIGTALNEALVNAREHGNLELNWELCEAEDGTDYGQLARERIEQSPYAERRIYVTATLSSEEAKYVVRDEGPGFDPSTIPDPNDPESLLMEFGRGLMLIHSFMDEVRFNDAANEITMIKRHPSETSQ